MSCIKRAGTIFLLIVLCLFADFKAAAVETVSLANAFRSVPKGMNSEQLGIEFGSYLERSQKFQIALRGGALARQNDELALTQGGSAVRKIKQADYTAECFLTLDGRIMKFSVKLFPLKGGSYPVWKTSASLRAFCDDNSLKSAVATELLEGVAEMLASDPQKRLLKAVSFYEKYLRDTNQYRAEKNRMQAADWSRHVVIQQFNFTNDKSKVVLQKNAKSVVEWINQGYHHYNRGEKAAGNACFKCALDLLKLKSFQEMKRYEPLNDSPRTGKDWRAVQWKLTFKWLGPGRVKMNDGSEINIEKGFWISEKPVSRLLYQTFIEQAGIRNGFWKKDYVISYYEDYSPLNKSCRVKRGLDVNKPMDCVGVRGAEIFAAWLSNSELDKGRNSLGMEYKLPSREEWLYAAKKIGINLAEGYSEWTRSKGPTESNIVVSADSCGEKSRPSVKRGFRIVLTHQ